MEKRSNLELNDGAKVENIRIQDIKLNNGRPIIFSERGQLSDADLVVGACGISPVTMELTTF